MPPDSVTLLRWRRCALEGIFSRCAINDGLVEVDLDAAGVVHQAHKGQLAHEAPGHDPARHCNLCL